jgi:hypothetical protein
MPHRPCGREPGHSPIVVSIVASKLRYLAVVAPVIAAEAEGLPIVASIVAA